MILRRTKLTECADAMNFNWPKLHSALPHRLAELADSCVAVYCATSSLLPFVEKIARRLGDGHDTVVRLVNGMFVLDQAERAGQGRAPAQ
jgi:phosphoserine phosphatase